MNSVICETIRRRAVVSFSYGGGSRTVEPHCHGVTTAGNEVLRGYQTGGYSESGNSIGWKLFEVSKIVALRQTGNTFLSNRPDYKPNDSAMTRVHCRV